MLLSSRCKGAPNVYPQRCVSLPPRLFGIDVSGNTGQSQLITEERIRQRALTAALSSMLGGLVVLVGAPPDASQVMILASTHR